MILKSDNFIVECNDNLQYASEIVSYLEIKKDNIMQFFQLKSLSSPKKIIIYSDLESYKAHIEQFFKYYDYMCADTNDGNINILSLEAARETKMYSNMDIEKLKSTILHEFVHICQQECEVEHFEDDIVWFWEGLATNLGNPEEYECIPINATNEDINNFNCSSNNYPIAYTIGNYMLENYDHANILKYIKYPSNLLADSDKILDAAREWSNQKNKVI